MSWRPIRHAEGGQLVLMRNRWTLEDPCRGGRLRVAAGGPVQLFLDGHRIGGAPCGALAENPLWHPLRLEGTWDAGVHELLAVIGAGPAGGRPWMALEGHLSPSVAGTSPQPLVSGLHWQSLVLPPAPASTAADERYSALEDRRHLDDAWEGVETVPGLSLEDEAPPADERWVTARRFAAFAETPAGAELSFAPRTDGTRSCKCVHRDALTAASASAATVATPRGRALAFVLDLGRVVSGYPALRLREGRGGVIDVGVAATWGRIDRRLTYVCGSGRQEWLGLAPCRGRYLVVRLSGFEEELQLERLAMAERFVAVDDGGARLTVDADYDRAWAVGSPSLQSSRLDVYHTDPPPAPCDWLATRILIVDDAARTGHTASGRATLLGRAPAVDGVGLEDRALPLCLEAYHMVSGDDATARRLLPTAVAAALLDGAEPAGARSLALEAAAASAAAGLSARLGDETTAQRCRQRAEAARQGLEPLWDADRGLYADDGGGGFSQLTNGLVLLADAAPEERAAQIPARLRGDGVQPVTDLTQAFHLAEGLCRGGYAARALEVLDSWWVRIAEREGLTWRDKRGREATGAAPGPDHLLTRYLLGLRPLSPGYARLRAEPALDLATRADGRLPTPAGAVGLAWSTTEEEGLRRTSLRLQVDGQAVTELALDRGGRRNPTLAVNGEVVWRNEKIYPNASVHQIEAEPAAVVLVFGHPGTWEVTLE